MSNRFSYVKYTPESVAKQEAFKSMYEAIESYAEKNLPEGRAKSLLLTALEESYMWSGKAIRDEQMHPQPPQYATTSLGIGGQVRSSDDIIRHRPERG